MWRDGLRREPATGALVEGSALAEFEPRWHLIGHLQRNKLRRTLPHLTLIHSVDSRRLLTAIDGERGRSAASCRCFSKSTYPAISPRPGFAPDELESVLGYASGLSNVAVRGLMGMAALVGGSEQARRDFAGLRELRDRVERNTARQDSLPELSMGMSGDFESAIAEGATLIRVGSALFEGVDI